MGAWDTLPRDWTNAVIAMSKTGVPTDELAGNTVFTDRLRKYVAGIGRLVQMRPRYESNQKLQTPDLAVTKTYHGVMELLQREAKELNRIAKNYLNVISGWSIKFQTNSAAINAINNAGVYRNHIEAVTDVSNSTVLKAVKPARPIRPDKPPPIPPRPGQRVSQGNDPVIYSNHPGANYGNSPT